jgi:thiol-disulfide isomerase/thioredoxin
MSLCVYVFALLTLSHYAIAAKAPSKIIKLSLATFYEEVEKGITAILFCQRSIPRCPQLERDFAAASHLSESDDVAFAIVGEKQRGIARLLAVTPPSIVIFRNGALFERYIGSKVPLDLARYLDALAADPSRTAKSATVQPKADSVLRLAAGDGELEFQSLLATATTVLVAFTTHDCSHCRRLVPQLATAAAQLLRDRSAGRVAEIDCDDLRTREQVCKQQSLTAFPALLLFRRGQMMHRYPGARTAEAIAEHVRQYSSMRTEL